MSNCSGDKCPQPINCCSAKCPVDQVICINCCVPISAICNNASTQTVFQSVNPCESVDGLVTITNENCPATLPGCTMFVTVETRSASFTFFDIFPGDLESFFVNDLISIRVSALGANTAEIARGTADLQLRKKIQLDC